MNLKVYFPALCIAAACSLLLPACEKKTAAHSSFTKADSLTETYLALQDTVLQAWYTMIYDDNRKIKSMRRLLHEISVANPEKREALEACAERLDRLIEMRYDQHSMSDGEIIEYDFASNSLVAELIVLAESEKEFAYNNSLQKLVDSIRAADQRVSNYREEYDLIALQFNRFLECNRETLLGIVRDSTLGKKPLFHMAAE